MVPDPSCRHQTWESLDLVVSSSRLVLALVRFTRNVFFVHGSPPCVPARRPLGPRVPHSWTDVFGVFEV